MAKALVKALAEKRYLGYLLAALLGVLFALIPGVEASFLPLPGADDLDVPTPQGDTAVEQLEYVLGPAGRVLRIVIGAVAVLMIVMSGFIMVVKGESEEDVKREKKAITYGIVGLLMISIAGPIAEVFDFREGNPLADPDAFIERAGLFDDTTRVIVTFLKYLLGSLAALAFIGNGATLVAGSYSEENVTKAKKGLLLSVAGLFLVVISDLIVRKILFDAEYSESDSATVVSINQNEFITQIVGITNLLVSFVGPIMMLGLVIGGVIYVTAGGDEEKTNLAKKIIKNSIIGIIVIYGAFAVVSTVITGVF